MCVYITWLLETAYTILKRKQTERWTKRRNTQLRSNKLLSITARGEERKRRRGREKKWKGERQEEETRDGRSTKKREKKLKDGGCTSIYCTHSMTDLHTTVVNSFVF